MKNCTPSLKRSHPEMTCVNSTHILMAKSNLMTLANVKRMKGQSLHVPGRRRSDILVDGIKVFLRFQSWRSLSFN